MKSFRSNRLAHLVLMTAVSAAAAEAGATSDTSGAQETTEVPGSTEPTVETKARAPKDPAKALDILNGRMPLPIV